MQKALLSPSGGAALRPHSERTARPARQRHWHLAPAAQHVDGACVAAIGARRRRSRLRCAATADAPQPSLSGKKVLILGGTGRVGSSSASALLKTFPGIQVALGSRSKESYGACLERRPELRGQTAHVQVDVESESSVQAALAGHDLVVHAAGPFQRSESHAVLKQAVAQRVKYMDVSDDMHYSEQSQAQFGSAAAAAGVPAIVSAGIYPGTSNVMAAHVISIARKEYTDDWAYRQPEPGEGLEPVRLRYSYYTAGSGGAGPTILETSLLLAGEPVILYEGGKRTEVAPVSYRREVDFGPGVGRKGTYLYNLPESQSGHKYLGVPSVSARFGTDPFVWNWAMWLTARLVPRALLADRQFVRSFARLADPLVRAVDKVAGEVVAMKVEVDFEQGKNSGGLFVHQALPASMGYSVAAFAQALLLGRTRPGVWYPEQKEALSDRREFLRLAATGCARFEVNRSRWALASEPTSLGGLIYLD